MPTSTLRATPPIRILTAVPHCDGHDSAISTINLEFIRNGVEVIYLGYHRSARDIARAAVQEDVRAIGISSYNGGHVEFFSDVLKQLHAYGAPDIAIFGGGGGTITREDARRMQRKGVSRIFFAGTPLAEMTEFVKKSWAVAAPTKAPAQSHPDHRLARLLTTATLGETKERAGDHRPRSTANGNGHKRGKNTVGRTLLSAKFARNQQSLLPGKPRVIGFCGPGGAGKTTLIDELLLRFLRQNPDTRIAILSHDPSILGAGALLGDRAAMFHAQSERVFMRSLASAGQAGGLSPTTEACLQILKGDPVGGGFDVILIETVGIGQEAVPFAPGMVDRTVFVMSPEYGSRLQLQKIAMLDAADVVVVNKGDMSAAKAAVSEVRQRLEMNHRGQQFVAMVAKRHRDQGVNELFAVLNGSPLAKVVSSTPGGVVNCV